MKLTALKSFFFGLIILFIAMTMISQDMVFMGILLGIAGIFLLALALTLQEKEIKEHFKDDEDKIS